MAQTPVTTIAKRHRITARRNTADSKAFGSPVWDFYEAGQLVASSSGDRNKTEALSNYLGGRGLYR